MRRGDSGIEPELQPFLLYMLNRFAYKKHWVLFKPTSYLLDVFHIRYVVSPERRCSSRTFRYGYLVTT